MQCYSKFFRFYDRVMGDRSDAADYIHDLIELYHPHAKTLLEIACGTGGLLGRFSETYDVTGLDRSRPMLAIARQRLPHIRLLRQDITSFAIDCRFDAVVAPSTRSTISIASPTGRKPFAASPPISMPAVFLSLT